MMYRQLVGTDIMQLRISRTTRSGRTYEYAQLVESVRRESDGMPTHRVIASLGALTPLEIENLRTTLKASREKKRVEVALPAKLSSVIKPTDNLKYLDLAVLLEIWAAWGLTELLAEVLPAGEQELSPALAVACLALQRCVEPGSKLKSTQWLPGTALPELLGVSPARFNNTRIHRVLDDLDAAGHRLMQRLPELYQERAGAFCSLFLDVTDTWFVGDGPDLARSGKTKEGFVRKKVGIVLLCDQRGYPLHWEVIAGNTADCCAMTQTMKEVARLDWARGAPIVVDRAMGRSAQIREMAKTGLRFLTALTVNEFPAYSDRIPFAPFQDIEPSGDDAQAEERGAQAAAAVAAAAGMSKAEENLYVLDLGTSDVPAEEEPASRGPNARLGVASLAEAMRLSQAIEREVREGQSPSYTQAAEKFGLTKTLGHKYGTLRQLPEDIQEQVLAGRAEGYALADLRYIARLDSAAAQREAFQKLVSSGVGTGATAGASEPRTAQRQPAGDEPLPQVRVLAYFNPTRFVDQRRAARERLKTLDDFVGRLNAAAARPRSRWTESKLRAAVDRELRKYDLVEAFDVEVTAEELAGRQCQKICIRLRQDEWERRRRYDGFTVLICHTDLKEPAVEMCRLYRAKDAVEKDFQTIKSFVELRPVRHHTDGKVRAHVTICMLALLLKQTLAQRLSGESPQRALEILRGCHLNRFELENQSQYALTILKEEQRAILRALKMQHLADDAATTSRITPR